MTMTHSGLDNNVNLIAFSAMIAWAEGTYPNKATKCFGYDVVVTGIDKKPEIFTDFSNHPFENRPAKQITSKGLYSTASGRYQILLRYWRHYQKKLSLPDFSPESQNKYFVQILKEQKAYQLVLDGKIEEAIVRVSNIWASLPSAGYGQPERKKDDLLHVYEKESEARLLEMYKAEEMDVSANHAETNQVVPLSELIKQFHSIAELAGKMIKENQS